MPKISVITPTIRFKQLQITADTLDAQLFKDFEWLVVGTPPSGRFTLPSDFNKALRASTGELIVILEDCIEISPTALGEIWQNHVMSSGTTCFTFPVGKKQADGSIVEDWRASRKPFEPILAREWEIDFAAAPRKAFFDVGGFDEAFCDGWSWENVEIAYRMEAAGYHFTCDSEQGAVAWDHDVHLPHPTRNILPNNDERADKTRLVASVGIYKLDFLK